MAKTKNPLEGKRVVLTRADNEELSLKLSTLGADVLEIPLIDCTLGANEDVSNDFLSNIASYDWITFASANGVRGFFKEFFGMYTDIRCFGPMRIACVGDATAREVAKYHLMPEIIARPQTAQAMVEEMMEFESLENRNVICVGGSLSNKDFIKTLEQKGGAIAEFFEVYKTDLISPDADDKIIKDFKKHGADFVVFASSSAVQSFAQNAAKFKLSKGAATPKAVSIGVSTSGAVKKFGIPLAAEAETSSVDGLVGAILKAVKTR